MDALNIVDLTLHAASICQFCRMGTRPSDVSDQEHGNAFEHVINAPGKRSMPCSADQVWVLIRRMEAK